MLSTTRRLIPTTTALFRATTIATSTVTPNFVPNPRFNRARAFTTAATTADDSDPVHEKISKLVHDNRVVLFMKGSPAAPNAEGLTDFTYVDVLKSDAVREGTSIASPLSFSSATPINYGFPPGRIDVYFSRTNR
ncbi:hypothetical protein Pmar_PMAR022410 [Perkinsus marinus ATCC 50983]|uniref:Uncharacterized protein n=1 Tax=Perkinsus marinus (strain ATCC 50983 / TXsc) TaxID=423536 RepID=C5LRH4_PERM5|nr:hypothetical protein Pmar_PMAR022410 [Perkinsus marinus ATCC 50983]EER00668.1 hypothetical protein Pmar_PMAR022410 [Perkinsus marinus ATCC 50983]|eukprot:XP_002767950.1 hypothetical protein Pmar_PMAR022410 [Perkinsus marinus ATCC 50983]